MPSATNNMAVHQSNYAVQYQDLCSPPLYDQTPDSHTDINGVEKPIVIPQSTNLFHIKSLSPFTRCYAPSLATLPSPIPEEEFLAFIDRLNQVFISNPCFQVGFVAGGMLMSTQILPVMAAGGVLQVGSALASGGVSFVRVRKFMKESNTKIFAPRGLVCKILTTKEMIAEVGFTDTDAKGKLKLHPLELEEQVPEYDDQASVVETSYGVIPAARDPRLMRLKALEGFIAPLEFDDSAYPDKEGRFSKIGQAPLRWMNKNQIKKFHAAKTKSIKKQEKREKNSSKSEVLGVGEGSPSRVGTFEVGQGSSSRAVTFEVEEGSIYSDDIHGASVHGGGDDYEYELDGNMELEVDRLTEKERLRLEMRSKAEETPMGEEGLTERERAWLEKEPIKEIMSDQETLTEVEKVWLERELETGYLTNEEREWLEKELEESEGLTDEEKEWLEAESKAEGLTEQEIARLEMEEMGIQTTRRNTRLTSRAQVSGLETDKRVNKAYKQEEKIANRILWIVIKNL